MRIHKLFFRNIFYQVSSNEQRTFERNDTCHDKTDNIYNLRGGYAVFSV